MSKYKSKKVVYDGITFDSKKEMNRYIELRILENAGYITELERQYKIVLVPTFKLNGKTYRSICYYADFIYYDLEKKQTVVEDVKSRFTKQLPVYKIKKKLLAYFKKIEIKEIE